MFLFMLNSIFAYWQMSHFFLAERFSRLGLGSVSVSPTLVSDWCCVSDNFLLENVQWDATWSW